MTYKGRASDVENHMVVGPDEFDEVVKCKHEDWSIVEVETASNDWAILHIRCDSCREMGNANISISDSCIEWWGANCA